MTTNSALRLRAVAWLTAVAASACGGSEGRLSVDAEFEGVPLAALEIAALPVNPTAVLDSLAAEAALPRPTFPGLEATLQSFVPPDERALEASTPSWRPLRDSVVALTDSLERLDRRTAGYAAMYARFRHLYGRLVRRTADRDAAIRELSSDDRRLAEAARQAAESLRAWEDTAYAAFPTVVETAAVRLGRTPKQAVTDSLGRLQLTLEPGRWWLMARYPDPRNPFEEYAWVVPVRVYGWQPVRVPVFAGNAERRWRH